MKRTVLHFDFPGSKSILVEDADMSFGKEKTCPYIADPEYGLIDAFFYSSVTEKYLTAALASL